MNIGEFSLKNRTSTLVVTLLFIFGGMYSYNKLGRLEDPEFTIKTAVVITQYPGATAKEVEQEVTDLIERAVQQMGQLEDVQSQSQKGLSIVTANMKDRYDKDTLPQVWDELRRKVNDVQSYLPPGAGPSIVNDDFGDVYGIFFALTGDGYSYKELEDVAKYLQRELLLVEDVAKIVFFGDKAERIYVEMSRQRMAQFGIQKDMIYKLLSEKNLVVDAGKIHVGTEYIQLRPTGEFDTVEEIGDLLISQSGGASGTAPRFIRLRDIATIRRDYQDPPGAILRVNGQHAIALAISTVQGGNVVTMGDALTERMVELAPTLPFGMDIHPISVQSEAVTTAINGFVSSLLQAIAIVIVVLMLFMGLKSGVLIGLILLLTILGTFIIMDSQGVMLERISLGALIIALGMLVDNAIVITEGMMIRLQRGEEKLKAVREVVGQNAIPLFGATVIAVLAFAAIGTSQDSAGEFCRSLFQVILYSLMLSWLTAVTITPLFCTMAFKPDPKADASGDPYSGGFFKLYRNFLVFCIRRRWLTVLVMIVMLAAAILGFGKVEQSFFPDSTRPQFQVDFWLPQGTHIYDTEREVEKAEAYLQSLEGVTAVYTSVGQGMPRFLLTYSSEKTNSSYAYFMVSVEDSRIIPELLQKVQQEMEEKFPDSIPIAYPFMLGPGESTKIQARFIGPASSVLRELAEQAMNIMHEDGQLIGIQTDWRGMVKDYRPILAEVQARNNGIERADVAAVLQEAFDGKIAGIYREGKNLIPIVSRPPEAERQDVADIKNLVIWSPVANRNIPLQQVVAGFETVFADSQIFRRDRQRAITVKCNPREGNASVALARIMSKIEDIPLPVGYHLEWGGEYDSSKSAQESLAEKIPLFVLMMILIVIFLFNNLRQPLIIWLCVPLAIIGVTAGLLLTRQPFGFMSLLGLLSLSGMLIKNAIVLIDQINIEVRSGKRTYDAILDSGVSRMRPVMMAAATTVLGMVPLLFDAFFVAMAVTIMAGLTFASILTLVVVPVLYAIFYKAKEGQTA